MPKKVASKAKAKKVKEEAPKKDTLNLPVHEQSHPEYDADMPLNKQRHLR